jgi:hypothetical protein
MLNPMRIVGNKQWSSLPASPAEAISRGHRLDALTQGVVPDFQPKGVFRGTQAYFNRMDDEKMKKTQAWLHEHTRRPA